MEPLIQLVFGMTRTTLRVINSFPPGIPYMFQILLSCGNYHDSDHDRIWLTLCRLPIEGPLDSNETSKAARDAKVEYIPPQTLFPTPDGRTVAIDRCTVVLRTTLL